MTLTYTISFDDYKQSAWVHMRPRRSIAILGVFFLVLAATGLGLSVFNFLTKGQDGKALLMILVPFGCLVIYHFVWFPYKLRQTYQQLKLLQLEHTAEISEACLFCKNQHGQATLPWDVFHRWKSGKQLVLLYQADTLYHLFPRRAFASEEDFNTFQTILRAKLGTPK